MATEMATPISATQNSKTAAKASKTTAKPRAARDKASAPTAPSATKTPRARSSRASAKSTDPTAKATEGMDASGASIDRALLEKESSKSLSASTPKPACKAHCGQCGREMRFVPFSLSNLMCRSCYGLDRYRRPVAPTVASASTPSNTSS